MTSAEPREQLLAAANALRTGRISTSEALSTALPLSRLPRTMAIEWFTELVHGLDLADAAQTAPLKFRPVTDALDHLAPA